MTTVSNLVTAKIKANLDHESKKHDLMGLQQINHEWVLAQLFKEYIYE